MLRAIETALTHSEVSIAGASTKDQGHKHLLPLPAYQRPGVVTRIGPSASVYGRAICSGRPCEPWVSEAADSVGVREHYAQFCKWTSENLPSWQLDKQKAREEGPGSGVVTLPQSPSYISHDSRRIRVRS
jgi:hypothetical protein